VNEKGDAVEYESAIGSEYDLALLAARPIQVRSR